MVYCLVVFTLKITYGLMLTSVETPSWTTVSCLVAFLLTSSRSFRLTKFICCTLELLFLYTVTAASQKWLSVTFQANDIHYTFALPQPLVILFALLSICCGVHINSQHATRKGKRNPPQQVTTPLAATQCRDVSVQFRSSAALSDTNEQIITTVCSISNQSTGDGIANIHLFNQIETKYTKVTMDVNNSVDQFWCCVKHPDSTGHNFWMNVEDFQIYFYFLQGHIQLWQHPLRRYVKQEKLMFHCADL